MASSAIRRTRRISPALQNATLIKLTNVSLTATPADIRRLVLRSQIPGVEDVAIGNTFLEPNGTAFLKLAHSDYMAPAALEALEKVTISGLHPVAEPNLASDGKNVVVWGFPEILDPAALDRDALGGFSFPPGEDYIFKIATAPKYSSCSRFMVRLASVPEAHRLVRQLHMTYWRPDYHGNKYLIRARVVY